MPPTKTSSCATTFFFSHWEMCVRVRVHVCVRSHKFGMLQESFKCHWKPSTGHKRINSGGTFPKFCWVVAEKTCLLVTLRIQNHRISRAKQLSGNGAQAETLQCLTFHKHSKTSVKQHLIFICLGSTWITWSWPYSSPVSLGKMIV